MKLKVTIALLGGLASATFRNAEVKNNHLVFEQGLSREKILRKISFNLLPVMLDRVSLVVSWGEFHTYHVINDLILSLEGVGQAASGGVTSSLGRPSNGKVDFDCYLEQSLFARVSVDASLYDPTRRDLVCGSVAPYYLHLVGDFEATGAQRSKLRFNNYIQKHGVQDQPCVSFPDGGMVCISQTIAFLKPRDGDCPFMVYPLLESLDSNHDRAKLALHLHDQLKHSLSCHTEIGSLGDVDTVHEGSELICIRMDTGARFARFRYLVDEDTAKQYCANALNYLQQYTELARFTGHN